MNTFLVILKGLFRAIIIIVIATIITILFFASIETLILTKENNILLKELCIEQGMNVDNLLNKNNK